MGGLVALHLAAARPDEVLGVVALAPAMRFHNPRARYAGLAAPFKPMWGDPKRDMGAGWADPERGRRHGNYRQFPIKAFVSLYNYARVVERQLPRIRVPALIIHSHADKTIPGTASERVYELIQSTHKDLVWFEQSGHEILRDIESDAVLTCVEQFVADCLVPTTLDRPKE